LTTRATALRFVIDMALKATSSASLRRLTWIATNLLGRARHAAIEDLLDDRPHARLPDADPRRDLADCHTPRLRSSTTCCSR
jgi:hypothetical protein